MRVRLLSLGGPNGVEEIEWEKPPIKQDEICVKAVMTGVCTSDIAMMTGKFKQLPLHMQGHEGLGIVTEVGYALSDYIKAGDYVATRGEPAYADFYNVKRLDFRKVPELSSKYILEPVACGVNIIYANKDRLYKLNKSTSTKKSVLIYGSGFMAWCAYNSFKYYNLKMFNIDVVGNHNQALWDTIDVKLRTSDSIMYNQYDVIIDLNPNNTIDFINTTNIVNDNALIIIGCPKLITTDFSELLWKNCTLSFPSPRNANFFNAMADASSLVDIHKLDVDYFWTKKYNRDTEWKNAFINGQNRPPNYNRGYIEWPH